ncbi:MAG: glycosyltransferase family 39 protein [Chloroflexi bacterium]|nr:glycosyltransferase family 39 protein [Chloroflexota bacterium]
MAQKTVEQISKFALLALILIATTLRFYRLAALDIWGDEAFSIFLSQQPLPFVVAGGADTHPPLYPLLLWTWLPLVGSHAFATRALAALVGILAVPLIFVLGKRVADTRVAFIAAILTTASPLLIYYSQETRMYEQVAVLSLASAYFCLTLFSHALKGVAKKGEAGFLLSTLLAMYTHYSAFFVWVAENIFVALLAFRQWLSFRANARNLDVGKPDFSSRKTLLEMTGLKRWAILQLVLIVAYIPWVLVQTSFLRGKASARFDEWSWRGIEMIFGKTFLAFSASVTLDFPLPQMIAVLFLLFAIVGAVIAARQRDSSQWFAPLYWIVPVVIAFVVNPIMPFFFERYVLVALPGFYLTVALGIAFVARRVPITAVVIVGVMTFASGFALWNFYFNDAYAKGMYGRMMTYVSQHAQPGDALILNNPLQKPLYDYYAPREVPAFYLPDGAPLEDPATRAQLATIARDHARVWLVMFGNPAEYDPTGYLERWLGANAFRSYSRGFVDASLSLYEMPRAATAIQRATRARLGDHIELVGYALNRESFAPGETVLLTLRWQTTAPISQRYKVFTHLLGALNPATQSPVWAQMDSEPVGGSRATTAWQTGETIEDRYGLAIPADAPPGEYGIEIGMYDPATLARVPVFDAQGARVADDHILLSTVRVSAR